MEKDALRNVFVKIEQYVIKPTDPVLVLQDGRVHTAMKHVPAAHLALTVVNRASV